MALRHEDNRPTLLRPKDMAKSIGAELPQKEAGREAFALVTELTQNAVGMEEAQAFLNGELNIHHSEDLVVNGILPVNGKSYSFSFRGFSYEHSADKGIVIRLEDQEAIHPSDKCLLVASSIYTGTDFKLGSIGSGQYKGVEAASRIRQLIKRKK